MRGVPGRCTQRTNRSRSMVEYRAVAITITGELVGERKYLWSEEDEKRGMDSFSTGGINRLGILTSLTEYTTNPRVEPPGFLHQRWPRPQHRKDLVADSLVSIHRYAIAHPTYLPSTVVDTPSSPPRGCPRPVYFASAGCTHKGLCRNTPYSGCDSFANLVVTSCGGTFSFSNQFIIANTTSCCASSNPETLSDDNISLSGAFIVLNVTHYTAQNGIRLLGLPT